MSLEQSTINKILTFFIIISLLINLWLIFSLDDDKPKEEKEIEIEEIIDSDNDGYPDNEDAFPNHPDMYDFFVRTDTTWTVDKGPYIITQDLMVNIEATLTIYPGVTVELIGYINNSTMYDATDINVHGTLIIKGTPDNMVTFTTNESKDNERNYDLADWGAIYINKTSENTKIEYCIIEFARIGIVIDSKIWFENNEIRNCGDVGINSWRGSRESRIKDNIIDGCGHGIYGYVSGSMIIYKNKISNNRNYGITITSSDYLLKPAEIVRNSIIGNQMGIRFIYTEPNAIIRSNNISNNNIGISCNVEENFLQYLQLSNNSILNNEKYAIETDSSIKAEYNYWGTTNEEAIENKMNGDVDFTPWLNQSKI